MNQKSLDKKNPKYFSNLVEDEARENTCKVHVKNMSSVYTSEAIWEKKLFKIWIGSDDGYLNYDDGVKFIKHTISSILEEVKRDVNELQTYVIFRKSEDKLVLKSDVKKALQIIKDKYLK